MPSGVANRRGTTLVTTAFRGGIGHKHNDVLGFEAFVVEIDTINYKVHGCILHASPPHWPWIMVSPSLAVAVTTSVMFRFIPYPSSLCARVKPLNP
jgi:hypothetical protein